MFLVLRTGAACRLIGAHAAIGSGCGWVGIWRNRWAFALCLPLPLRLAVPLTLCFPLGVALRVPLAFARAALPITTIAAVTPLTASATLAGPSRALLRTVTLTLALTVARAVAATITPVATLAAAMPVAVAVATAIAIAIAMIAT